MKYKECDKIVKQKAFEKAIAVEAKSVDLALEVEASLDSISEWCIILALNIIQNLFYLYTPYTLLYYTLYTL